MIGDACRGLASAIADRENEYARVIDHLRDAELIDGKESRLLSEAIELVGCLRRVLPSVDSGNAVHKAFGAPGDFGYDTPIGDALARFYGVIP